MKECFLPSRKSTNSRGGRFDVLYKSELVAGGSGG